jgi:cytochrome c oxidase assembly protein subunit 15
MKAYTRFAWAVLALNLAVVAWGAFVRATGSGAGCGRHWPTCQGEIVPRSPATATSIEFAHRASSGLALAAVVALGAWSVVAFPRRHAARRAALASVVLIALEALLGAALVLFGWVANDASLARGFVMPVHLTNTFFLLGALALTAEWSARPGGASPSGRGRIAGALALAAAAVLVTGATGAIAALGDTLFPPGTLAQGLREDLSPGAHALLRLRVLHPFAAVATGAALVAVSRLALRARPDGRVRRAALAVAALVAAQIAAGVLSLMLLAPVWLQLVHLVLADLVWIALVLLSAAALAPASGRREAEPAAAA